MDGQAPGVEAQPQRQLSARDVAAASNLKSGFAFPADRARISVSRWCTPLKTMVPFSSPVFDRNPSRRKRGPAADRLGVTRQLEPTTAD
jgi:hypothetical protein